jgi:hypothetical protein
MKIKNVGAMEKTKKSQFGKKASLNPDGRTTINFNFISFDMLNTLMDDEVWGVSRSEAIRRLLNPMAAVIRDGIKDKHRFVEIKFRVSLNKEDWEYGYRGVE